MTAEQAQALLLHSKERAAHDRSRSEAYPALKVYEVWVYLHAALENFSSQDEIPDWLTVAVTREFG